MGTKSGYFRSRQGGRFKPRDSSDLGLRAYKDQQAAQIKAEEENLKTQIYYRDQAERGLEGSGNSKLWNLEILQNLEDKRFSNEVRATKVAKETELKKISDQAKIYGDKSKWLQEWAPKFYNNLYAAGTTGVELYERYQADKKFQELLESPEFQQRINILDGIEGKTRQDIITAKNKAYADKDVEAVEYLDGLLKNSNTYLSEKIANHLIDRFDGLEADLERYINSDEGADAGGWKAENVVEFYKMRARELIRQFGLTGKGATKLLNHFTIKGGVKSSELADNDKLISDTNKRNEKRDNILSKIGEGPELKLAINDAVITYINNSYRSGDERTGILKGFPNPRDALALLFTDVAKSGDVSDLEELKNAFLDSCTPASVKGNGTCVTYRQRHPKTSEGSLYADLDKIIVDVGKGLRKKSEDKKEGDDGFALNDWNNRINGTGIYAPGAEKEGEALTEITTEKHVEIAFTAYRTAKSNGNEKTMAAIGEVLYINPRGTSDISKLEGLWRESLTGDMNGAAFYWKQLTKEQRNDPRIIALYKPILRIKNAGLTTDQVKKQLKEQIDTYAGQVGLLGTAKTDKTATRLLPHHEQRFYYYLNKLEASGKYADSENTLIINDALELVNNDLKSNEGIYKVDNVEDIGGEGKVASKELVFSLFKNVDSPKIDYEQVSTLLKENRGSLMTTNDKNEPVPINIVKPIQLRETALDIQAGKVIDIPDSVHLAYDLSDKSMSKTDFVNALLKANGFSVQINPNANDIVDTKINKLWGQDGLTLKMRGSDRLVMDVYTNIINQANQANEIEGEGLPGDTQIGNIEQLPSDAYNYSIPMPNLYRFKDLKTALEQEYPNLNLDDISVNQDGIVNVKSNESYQVLLKNKSKLGLKFKPNPNGGFDLVSESNILWQLNQMETEIPNLRDQLDTTIQSIDTILNKPWAQEILKEKEDK